MNLAKYFHISKKNIITILPFTSLTYAIFTAILMNRRPEKALLIVNFSLLGWAFLFISTLYLEKSFLSSKKKKVLKTTQFLSNFATQSLMAQALYFPLPFYFYASLDRQPMHVFFWGVYCIAVILVSWDPFFNRLLKSNLGIAFFQGFSGFVALLTVLPMLGFSSVRTFLFAATGFSMFIPFCFITHQLKSKKYLSLSILLTAIHMMILYFLAPLIPPSPLYLKRSLFALEINQREPLGAAVQFINPPHLYCFSQIKAPMGLHDKLIHVWSLNGKVVNSIPLNIHGSEGNGYRTWSRTENPKTGYYTCSVETVLGQIVGTSKAEVMESSNKTIEPDN